MLRKTIRKIHHSISPFIKFNFSFGFWLFMSKLERKILPRTISFFTTKLHAEIIKYLSTKYADIVSEFKNEFCDINDDISPSSTIWIFWWDGIECMPDIVKACYDSVQRHKKTYSVQLVTKYNYKNFVSMPEYIMKKLDSKTMSITHFSDILRVSLLYEYGGIWMDATILVTDTINFDGFKFWTMKRNNKTNHVSQARWTTFLFAVGSKNIILFDFIKKMFYAYWKDYDEVIHYFLFDYIVSTAYLCIPKVRLLFDSVPYSNPDIYWIQNNLNEEYSDSLFKQYCSQITFHKLSWKKKNVIYTPEGKPTFYGHILTMQ